MEDAVIDRIKALEERVALLEAALKSDYTERVKSDYTAPPDRWEKRYTFGHAEFIPV